MSRAARAMAPGMLVAAPAALLVWDASVRASWAALGRDQGIFQYVAWAVARGDVLYRDVRDVNGPLVALIHRAGLVVGTASEHRFRVVDLAITALTAAFAGGCVATLDDRVMRGGERMIRALSFGAAAAVVLTAQYLAYGFWDTAQRESFFDWFVLAAVGLQLVAQSLLRPGLGTSRTRRLGAVVLALSGAASVMPWFGKPTFVLFTLGQVLALAFDDLVLGRWRRTALVALGAAMGALAPLAFLLLAGDGRAWARITFVDVPAMYRFIWPRTFVEILRMPGHGRTAALATLASALVVMLVVTRRMPRRGLPLAVMPIAGLASVALQAKGFAYHFHPVTAGTSFVLVAIVHQAWARAEARPEKSRRGFACALAGLLSLALGARTLLLAHRAPYPPAPHARDAPSLVSRERLAAYDRIDFFPRALRDAAEYVASHTAPSDTVQTYGMDPYVLFLAQRRSATPYIYAYDLDADAALAGGFEEGTPRPDRDQARIILAMRDEHERDLLARLQARPPAAFVFVNRSPLMSSADAVRDFEDHCPSAFAWVRSRYVESASFEGIRVWLRLKGDGAAGSSG